MARYIECETACAEVDKGDLLVGNNAEFAKEIIYRTPTADVVPKSEVIDDHHKQVACYTLGCREGDKIKRELAREILSDIKKKIHDRAVYTNSQDIPNYINLKVFDAILQNYLNKLE